MSAFSCKPCDKFFTGKIPYEMHLLSERHKKKVNDAASTVVDSKYCEETSEGENTMSAFSCKPCEKFFTGKIPYEIHLLSERHKKKVNDATYTVMDSKYCEKTFEGENTMSAFSCKPCEKFFTGKIPYEIHLLSERHKKKVNDATNTVMDSKYCEKTSEGENEPFIVIRDTEYWCSCCKTSLNGVRQVKSHISGSKHQKLKISFTKELLQDIPNLSSSNIHATIPVDINQHNYHFSFHGTEVENVLSGIKIFGVNDPIVF